MKYIKLLMISALVLTCGQITPWCFGANTASEESGSSFAVFKKPHTQKVFKTAVGLVVAVEVLTYLDKQIRESIANDQKELKAVLQDPNKSTAAYIAAKITAKKVLSVLCLTGGFCLVMDRLL